MPNLPASLLWFVAVVALIPLALWLLKRSALFGAAAGSAPLLRTIATHALSPGQRLVIAEVGSGEDRRWLVLGVTAQSINTVYMMAPQELPAAQPAAASFAQVLRGWRDSRGADGAAG